MFKQYLNSQLSLFYKLGKIQVIFGNSSCYTKLLFEYQKEILTHNKNNNSTIQQLSCSSSQHNIWHLSCKGMNRGYHYRVKIMF